MTPTPQSAVFVPISSRSSSSAFLTLRKETSKETVRKVGIPFAPGYNLPYQENGSDRVQWRVIVELSSTVGAKLVHEVHVGGNATPGCSAATLGRISGHGSCGRCSVRSRSAPRGLSPTDAA